MTEPERIAAGLTKWWKRFVCEWFHGGGQIERDRHGRINWQCAECGRWGDSPVPLADEEAAVRAILERQADHG